MSEYLKKQAVLEWLDNRRYKSPWIESFRDRLESGAFDANNHLRFPRQANKEAGWTISYDYIRNIDKHICNTGTDETSSYEAIEQVLLAVEALNTSVTESKCKLCDGTGYDVIDRERKHYDSNVPCADCHGTGKLSEPWMTRDEILSMEPGRELNALVSRKLFEVLNPDSRWRPSEDISAAWEVVERLTKKKDVQKPMFADFSLVKKWDTYEAVFIPIGKTEGVPSFGCKSAPEAICKAALLAVGVSGG